MFCVVSPKGRRPSGPVMVRVPCLQVRVPWGTGQDSLGYRSGFLGSTAWSGFLEVLIRVPCGTGQEFLVIGQGSLGYSSGFSGYWSGFLGVLVRVPCGTG